MPDNPAAVRGAIFEALDNQLAEGNPPETRETLARLLAEGHSKQKARRLISCVLLTEVYNILKEGRPFDLQGYTRALRNLPELPKDQTKRNKIKPH